jgi:hypothetical protein
MKFIIFSNDFLSVCVCPPCLWKEVGGLAGRNPDPQDYLHPTQHHFSFLPSKLIRHHCKWIRSVRIGSCMYGLFAQKLA